MNTLLLILIICLALVGLYYVCLVVGVIGCAIYELVLTARGKVPTEERAEQLHKLKAFNSESALNKYEKAKLRL